MIGSRNTAIRPGETVFVVTSQVADLDHFDALPPPVRAAVREATVNLAAEPLLDFWLNEDRLDCMERMEALLAAVAEAGR